jgi:hypothetical protein
MARKPSNSPEDDLFSVKMVPYEQALADLKECIERHVKKDVKYRRHGADVAMPPIYRILPRLEE